MRVLALLVIAAIAALAALNWSAFTAPSSLWLGFAVIDAPLGIVMLTLAGLLTLLLGGLALSARTARVREARRYNQELSAQRELAERAEVSRIAELRRQLEADSSRTQELAVSQQSAIFGRIDQLERSTRASLEEAINTLSAHIGELDDRLERRFSDPMWTRPDQPEGAPRYRS